VVKSNVVDYTFANSSKVASMAVAYVVNKGTLLTNGKHTWAVRIDNISSSTDVGVVSPSHTSHFNYSTKTAWGLRESGFAYYTQVKACDGFKNGDILKFDLDLELGTLGFTINNVKVEFKHTDVVAPVHVAFSGGVGAQATIL